MAPTVAATMAPTPAHPSLSQSSGAVATASRMWAWLLTTPAGAAFGGVVWGPVEGEVLGGGVGDVGRVGCGTGDDVTARALGA